MKAKLVSESIEFKRGLEPKDALGVGMNRNLIDWWGDLPKPFWSYTHTETFTSALFKKMEEAITNSGPINFPFFLTSNSSTTDRDGLISIPIQVRFGALPSGSHGGHYVYLNLNERGDLHWELPVYLSDGPNKYSKERIFLGNWTFDPAKAFNSARELLIDIDKKIRKKSKISLRG